MKYIGSYYGREVFYLHSKEGDLRQLPESNWQCFAVANRMYDKDEVNNFCHVAFSRGLLGVITRGAYGGKLETEISLIKLEMEVGERFLSDVAISGGSSTDLANGFWNCFGAPALPEATEYKTLKLVCIAFDNRDYEAILEDYLIKFNIGWLPK